MSQDAKPFALVTRFTVRPGAEESFDALVAATAAGIRESEPGTLIYACHLVQGESRQRNAAQKFRDICYRAACSMAALSHAHVPDRVLLDTRFPRCLRC
jgi:hypothetical protein